MAVNETKRSMKRVFMDYGKLLEPVGILLLIIILVVPILTVINLTTKVDPMISQQQIQNLNVLGVQNDINDYGIQFIPGSHSVINPSEIEKVDSNQSQISITLNSHEAQIYTRPILEVYNNSGIDKTLTLVLSEYDGETPVSILINEEEYTLYNKYGPQIISLNVASGEKLELFLQLDSQNIVNYDSTLTLTSQFSEK